MSAGVAVALAIALPVSAADGHGDRPHGLSSAELRSVESEILGHEHATQHFEQRRDERRELRRWQSLSAGQRRTERRRERRATLELARVTAARAPAAETGRWTRAPFALPEFAIHSVMLPTGKVLFWGFPPDPPNVGNAALWDPSKGYGAAAFKDVAPPVVDPDGPGPQPAGVAPIYCSGQSLLASGEVLVTGGNLVFPSEDGDAYDDWAGLNRVFTFNPWTETWTEQPRMNDGRWYPTQVLLADGRTAVVGGLSEEAPGNIINPDVEVFRPGQSLGAVGSIGLRPEVSRDVSLYPHLFTMPNRKVLMAGPSRINSALLTAPAQGQWSWTTLPSTTGRRTGGAAVLRPGPPSGSWRATMFGGYGYTPAQPNGSVPATRTTETIDLSSANPRWAQDSPMKIGRSYQNTILLPDKSMVTVGGGIGTTPQDGAYSIDSDGARRQVEVFDPATGQWQLGPAQMEDRGYHATALLLPDGRVFSGGDNKHPLEPGGGNSLTDTGEIYSPPYLFQGTRPSIERAPGRIGWNQRIRILTEGSSQARSAVLVAPGATTHGTDMNQRLVTLKLQQRRGLTGIDVTSPPNAGVAPPGYYMLFVLNSKGVPSIAKWVKLGT